MSCNREYAKLTILTHTVVTKHYFQGQRACTLLRGVRGCVENYSELKYGPCVWDIACTVWDVSQCKDRIKALLHFTTCLPLVRATCTFSLRPLSQGLCSNMFEYINIKYFNSFCSMLHYLHTICNFFEPPGSTAVGRK